MKKFYIIFCFIIGIKASEGFDGVEVTLNYPKQNNFVEKIVVPCERGDDQKIKIKGVDPFENIQKAREKRINDEGFDDMYEASSVVYDGKKYVPQSDLILSFESKDDLDLSVYLDYKKGSKYLNGEYLNQGKIPNNMLPGLNRGDIINIEINFPVYKDSSGVLFIKESDQPNLVQILNNGNFSIKTKDEDLNVSVNIAGQSDNNTEKIWLTFNRSTPSLTKSDGTMYMFGGGGAHIPFKIVDKDTKEIEIAVNDIFDEIIKNLKANSDDDEVLINPWDSVIIHHKNKEYRQGDVIETAILENEPNRFHATLIKKPNIVFKNTPELRKKYKDVDKIVVNAPLTLHKDDVLGLFVDVTEIGPIIEQELISGGLAKNKPNLILKHFTKTNFFILFLLSLLGVSSYQAGWWKVLK